MDGSVKVGDAVVFIDEHRRERAALVLAVWGPPEVSKDKGPAINLVTVDANEGATDGYGRQREFFSSVVHESSNYAPGMFWRLA